MNTLLFIGAAFLVTLQPKAGVGGGPVKVQIEAHDYNAAKRIAQVQYGSSYRVSNVAKLPEKNYAE